MASSKPPLSMNRVGGPSSNRNYHQRKIQQPQTSFHSAHQANPVRLPFNMPGPVMPVHTSGPLVTIKTTGNFPVKPRLMTPNHHISPGQTIHIPLPPPPTPQFTSVLMSVPPPPIRHIGVPPSFSTRPPPAITTSVTVSNGTIPHGVHIHHGQLLQDPGISNNVSTTSNGLDRSGGYYSHSALAHHHHHHQLPNGNCQMQQSPTHCATTTTASTLYVNQVAEITTIIPSVSSSKGHPMSPAAPEFTPSEDTTTNRAQQSPPQENVKIKEKTPMCLINELARHNKTTHQYRLTDESGPSHKKNFTVCLKLGDTEEYLATGPSIKKAQHAAAAMALEKTKLKHPLPKPKPCTKQVPVTPTVELNTLAMKRGESATYTFIDQNSSSSYAAKFAHKRYQNGTNGAQSFRVILKVGSREFFGEAISAQAAKHNAAMNALKILKDLPLNSSSVGNCGAPATGCNPKSLPFVPSSQKNQDSLHDNQNGVEDEDEDGLSNNNNSDLVKSPISLVHESALKRNLVAHFEVTKETGPPHMRKFITRCRCGDFVTDGEGNGKKTSKKQAAEMMLEQLRHLPPLISCQSPVDNGNGKNGKSSRSGSSVSKKAEMKKRKAKNLIKFEQKAAPEYGQSINPISRLIQIQQAKKEKEPVYTLIAEKGMPRRREFIMQVTVGICSAKGSGPNKKLAKRAAAEALLQELGYSQKPPGLTGAQPAKPVLKPVGLSEKCQERDGDSTTSGSTSTTPVKKLTFSDETKTSPTPPSSTSSSTSATTHNKKIPGLIVIPRSTNSDKEVSTSVKRVNEITTVSVNNCNSSPVIESNHDSKAAADAASSKNLKSILSPKIQLASLADALSLKVCYRHINKKDKKDNFVSLVKLTTNPPKVFYGSGATLELSEVDAASKALLSIADSGIEEDTIDEIESESPKLSP